MTELIHRPAGALAVTPGQTDWTPDQRAALDSMGIDETASPGDLRVFLTYSQRTGLDPFARQIYMIGRNSKENVNGQWRWRKRYTIQVGIDGFRVIAKRSTDYRGQAPTLWCGDDGVWHDVWLLSEPPAAAKVGVYHAKFAEPLVAVALLREYAPRNNDGELTGQWASMPALMLAKCAEALALRKAFPNDLSGIYVAEEMDQSGTARLESKVPRTVSEIAVDVSHADDRDTVRTLWREAAAGGLLDEEAVDTDTGQVQTLRVWLTDLAFGMEVDAGSIGEADGTVNVPGRSASTPEIVDAELPEDDGQLHGKAIVDAALKGEKADAG